MIFYFVNSSGYLCLNDGGHYAIRSSMKMNWFHFDIKSIKRHFRPHDIFHTKWIRVTYDNVCKFGKLIRIYFLDYLRKAQANFIENKKIKSVSQKNIASQKIIAIRQTKRGIWKNTHQNLYPFWSEIYHKKNSKFEHHWEINAAYCTEIITRYREMFMIHELQLLL